MTGRGCELSSGVSTTDVSVIQNVEYCHHRGHTCGGRQLGCDWRSAILDHTTPPPLWLGVTCNILSTWGRIFVKGPFPPAISWCHCL